MHHPSRRPVLTALAVLSLAVPAAAGRATPAPDIPAAQRPYLHQTVRVDARVHVLMQRPATLPAPVSNVTVIEQGDGLVLVDAGASFGSGRRIVDLVRGLSRKPVKAVIITHWHPDHTMGLPALVAAWPQAEIIATAVTRDHMLGESQKATPKAPDPAWDQSRVAQLESYRTQAFDLDLTVPAIRQGLDQTMAFIGLRQSDAPGGYIVAPTRTFTDRLVIEDPVAPVEVRFLGKGDTDGDAVVWLPRQRILVAGDNVAAPIPFGFTAFQAEWIDLLVRLKAFDFSVLVPGHGELQRDSAFLDRLIALIGRVRAEVPPLAAQGLTAEQVIARMDFSAERKAFAGDDAWVGVWFDRYTVAPMVTAAWTAATQKPS